MARINLAAVNGAERRILEYLEANASEALAEKIAAGGKTLAGALKYCEGEARKLHSGGGNCVCVEDAAVFGWAVHYFEEQGTEDGGRKTEDGRRKAEGGERRTEGGEREAEDGGRKAEAQSGEVESVEAGDNPFEGAAIFGGVK